MKILAISGSLREASSNTRLLRALALLAPTNATVLLYDGLGNLPHFNPDLDNENPPAEVARFRQLLKDADAVAISSPEYAHGVPGTLKNALDWVVGSGEFVEKPVALINASPRATIAYESIAETLRTMTARILPNASITIPVPKHLTAEELTADPAIAPSLLKLLDGLVDAIDALPESRQ